MIMNAPGVAPAACPTLKGVLDANARSSPWGSRSPPAAYGRLDCGSEAFRLLTSAV